MKVTVCQLDNRAAERQAMLGELALHIAEEQSQFLLLPEMCFADWLAADSEPERARWLAAIKSHADHIRELDRLGAQAIIASRPVITDDDSCRNQAYLWTPQPRIQPVHEKYFLPDEPGYWEASWYQRGPLQFDLCEALGLRIGVQICTEMWFFEWARHFAREGAELLCVPRATPHKSVDRWLAGGRTAAICSGAFCLSSNLWTPPGGKVDCGGMGWIISPQGDVLAQTSEATPFATVDIDPELARQAKSTYPRYVAE